jgi:hypothetical protein
MRNTFLVSEALHATGLQPLTGARVKTLLSAALTSARSITYLNFTLARVQIKCAMCVTWDVRKSRTLLSIWPTMKSNVNRSGAGGVTFASVSFWRNLRGEPLAKRLTA